MQNFKGKKILIAGGTGSIGSELAIQILKTNPKELRIYSRDEHKQFVFSDKLKRFKNVRFLLGDVRDKANLRMAMDGVHTVINAAALKHVPHCEFNPIEAVKTNVYGTQNIIEVAIEKNVDRVLTISTDKATSPAGTMGASKLLSEKLMSAAQFQFGNRRTRFCSVRFGNVLGSRGSILNIFKDQIRNGGPVHVTDQKMTRFIMLIPEAASLVLKACLMAQGGEIFILKMPSVCLIDLVKAAVEHYAPRYGFNSSSIKIKTIGMRPGERLHETLLTNEETPTTVENQELFIVLPSLIPNKNRNMKAYGKDVHSLRSGKIYCSDKVKLLTKNQMIGTIERYEQELKRRAHFLHLS